MKRILKIFTICFICVILTAIQIAECPAQTVTKKSSEQLQNSNAAKKPKVLITYFSQSGTTKKVAEKIKKMTGADLFRIQTKKKYTSNYDKLVDIGLKEQKKNARPALKSKVKSIKQYDTIIIGYPIWWDDAPMAIYSFLESYNLSGKTILPFCTSGGSDISASVKHIKKVCKKSVVKTGLTANDVSDKKISNWLKKNKVTVKEEISVKLLIGKTNVTSKTYNMKTGTSKTLKTSSNEKISSISYTSSNPKAVSVSKKGVIKAKKSGTSKITVAVKTKQGSKKVWMKVKASASKPTPTPEIPDKEGDKTLIVYFTYTGNAGTIADIISEKTGAAKVRLETVKTYPSDYSGVYDEAMAEKNTNARPELKTKIEDMDTYDTIFVGYPIWHGDTPMAIRTFLEEYDFTGKTVIPYCTSGSSRPDTSFTHVKESAKGAKVPDGFWSTSSELGNLKELVLKWLDELGILKEDKENDTMKITVGDTVFTATLADNSSAAALKELLVKGPLTINMHDYANMEKVGPIGTSLPTNDEHIVTEPGDIILYLGNSLVIYYDTNTWNFTRIGRLNDVTQAELMEALGKGDVTVTFSLE